MNDENREKAKKFKWSDEQEMVFGMLQSDYSIKKCAITLPPQPKEVRRKRNSKAMVSPLGLPGNHHIPIGMFDFSPPGSDYWAYHAGVIRY